MSEAVIVASVRSAGARYRRGGLSETRADVLLSRLLKVCWRKFPGLILTI